MRCIPDNDHPVHVRPFPFERLQRCQQLEYENHDFALKLSRGGETFTVPSDRAATHVLAGARVCVDVKCADGICSVCRCGLVASDDQYRDFVLSRKQREASLILCQSSAAQAGGTIEVDL